MLEMFDSIIIENKNRIDQEDKIKCEGFNNTYNNTLECYKGILNSLMALYNKEIVIIKDTWDIDVSIYGDLSVSNTKDAILKLKESFISRVCYYFSNKYNVTINENKIYEKYKDIELEWSKKANKDKTLKLNLIEYVYLDYNIILDEIFIQLNGYSFLEKAINEIKEKAKMPLHWYSYQKYWNYEVKGKTIKFRTNIRDVQSALYYYDNNEKELIDCYTYNRIYDFKYYDNGNTDIKFINSSYTLEFAKKYLGYIEMTDEEREIYKKKCN